MTKKAARGADSPLSDKVSEYLKKQNRPYSATDLHSNLKSYPKQKIINALNELVASNSVVQKVYGKQSVFCISQSDIEVDANEMTSLDSDIHQLAETTIPELRAITTQLSSQLNALTRNPTTSSAQTEVRALQSEAAQLESEIEQLDSKFSDAGISLLSKHEISLLDTQHSRLMKSHRKYKRICMDVLNSISEGSGKKTAELIEDLDLSVPEA